MLAQSTVVEFIGLKSLTHEESNLVESILIDRCEKGIKKGLIENEDFSYGYSYTGFRTDVGTGKGYSYYAGILILKNEDDSLESPCDFRIPLKLKPQLN